MRDELIRQIEEATDDRCEIVGEIGVDPGRRGFLARERESGALVALALVGDELSVLRRLDAGVPVDGSRCAACHATLATWTDACPGCGARLVGDEIPGATADGARELLLDEVRHASRGEFEVLGGMDCSAGSVYFAREVEGGHLVALALRTEDEEDDAVSLAPTWIAPGAPLPDQTARLAPPPAHAPLPDPPSAPQSVATREPRSWVRAVVLLAGVVAIVLLVLAYVRGAPPAAGPRETPPAVGTAR